jgi:hypothetical protein
MKARSLWKHALLPHDGELYLLAKSTPRAAKERAMWRRRLKKLWRRLQELQQQAPSRDQLLLKLGAAKKEAGRVYGLIDIQVPKAGQTVTPETFTFRLRTNKRRRVRRREGHYLLRSNLSAAEPAQLWQYYLQLTEVEQADRPSCSAWVRGRGMLTLGIEAFRYAEGGFLPKWERSFS